MKIWEKALLTLQFIEIYRVGNSLLMAVGSEEPGLWTRNRGDKQLKGILETATVRSTL